MMQTVMVEKAHGHRSYSRLVTMGEEIRWNRYQYVRQSIHGLSADWLSESEQIVR